ncbi:LysR family transcriptional regulator [Trinickia soli]|uniref:LysR family transcriptional regulator n=1 Tax=Trinickia soli TaxID=380675 RepID=A0A2N7W5D6_9BURK|nr:LysR substrate-binding domain-containing protein [Trinickia soli]KAA0090505.1 LysR family transcriptional regulator [Paraburkholderia sp. T12-10]PMS24614.1 LysR family transcriptional regulator [Trinickia soli]CAB3651031.1 HTH-type transcriptional regulator YofA [Trinickia soli]
MFDSTLLRSFVTVAQEGSFTRAATRLHLTQSAVSAHLRRLEEQAGAALVERTTRSLALTPEGEVLLGYARAILALNRDARARLQRPAGEGPVRIGLSDDFAHPRVMERLHAFGLRHPGVDVSLTVGIPGTLIHALDRGELDFVMAGRCHGERPGRSLWREALVWAAAPWQAINLGLPLPLAVFPEPCPYRDAALAALAHAGVDFRVTVVCPGSAGVHAAVQAGLGVAPMPKSRVDGSLAIVGEAAGLPALPEVEFALFGAASPAALVDELCEAARRDLG